MTNTKRVRDFTQGAILPRVILFVLPIIATGILQMLFNTADTIVVGRWGGDTPETCEIALAAVGSCTALTNLFLHFFFGFSAGAGVCTAHAIGSKNEDGVQKTVQTAVLIGLIGGALLAVVGISLARPLLSMIGTKKEVLEQATLYLKAYLVGAPGLLLYNYCASILRSKGETVRPLIFLTVSGVINVLLNLLMVLVFRLGALGVGIATAASQWASALFVLVYMMRLRDSAHLDWRRLRIDPKTFKKMLYIGLPASIQGIVGGCSNVLIQSAVNSLGRVTVAANTAAANLVGYIYTAQNSLYHASLTFVGQNYGARKFKRLRRSVLTCVGTVTVLGLVLSSAVILLGEQLLSLYLPGNTEAIGLGMYHIWYIGGFYFILGIAEVGCGALRGLGKSLSAMLISLVGTVFGQVIWILTVFRFFPSLRVLYVSYPICWMIILVIFYAVFFQTLRRLERSEALRE